VVRYMEFRLLTFGGYSVSAFLDSAVVGRLGRLWHR